MHACCERLTGCVLGDTPPSIGTERDACVSPACLSGSFWLNPPLPMDEEGNWVGPTRPTPPAAQVDVDPY